MSLHILQLVNRLSDLKLKARTGWNMTFEPGDRYKTRCVPEAESVADHTYALAMHAFLVAIELGLDVEKAVTMALIHDAPESITGDGVTATLSPEERELALKDKKTIEYAAARELFLPHGKLGQRCYELWLEYEAQECEEARIVFQLDKFECAAQAVVYAKQGHRLDPIEFIDYAAGHITHPLIASMLDELRKEWTG